LFTISFSLLCCIIRKIALGPLSKNKKYYTAKEIEGRVETKIILKNKRKNKREFKNKRGRK